MATNLEVGLKWSGDDNLFSLSCFVFDKHGNLLDMVNEKQTLSASKAIRFSRDGDKTFAFNKQLLEQDKEASEICSTRINLFHVQPGLLVDSNDAEAILIVAEKRVPTGVTPEVFVLKHNVPNFDEEECGHVEVLAYQNIASFNDIPAANLVEKPRSLLSIQKAKYSVACVIERTANDWVPHFKDVPVDGSEHVTAQIAQLRSQLNFSMNNSVQIPISLRKGHCFFIPTKRVHCCFTWAVVGRKFNVDLAAIAFNKAGKIVDFMCHDKTQSFDQTVKKIMIDESLKTAHIPYFAEVKDKKPEIFDIVDKETSEWHTLVFTTSIFTREMNYLRVRDSILTFYDYEKKDTKYATFKISDTFETGQIWCKLTKSPKGFLIEIIDQPFTGSSYVQSLKPIREQKIVPFNPSAYDVPVLPQFGDNKHRYTVRSKMVIRYRSAEFSDDSLDSEPRNIILFLFDERAFVIDKKELIFPKRSEYSALEPETSITFQSCPEGCKYAFAIMSGFFEQQKKPSLVFLDAESHREQFQVPIMNPKMGDSEKHCLLFSMEACNKGEWDIFIQNTVFDDNSMESWISEIHNTFLRESIAKRTPSIRLDVDNAHVFKYLDRQIVVGISLKNKNNAIKCKAIACDIFGDPIGKVSKRNTRLHDETGKPVALHGTESDLFLIGEESSAQFKFNLSTEYTTYRHFAFVVRGRTGMVDSKDVILIRAFDTTTTITELFTYEIPYGTAERWVVACLTRDFKEPNLHKYVFNAKKVASTRKTFSQQLNSCLPKKPAFLYMNLISGKDLVSKDYNGFSDPYVKVKIPTLKSSPKVKSSTKMKTLNPEWNETLKIAMPEKNHELHIEIWDYDIGPMNSNDPMGAVYKNMNELVPQFSYVEQVVPQRGNDNSSDAKGTLKFSIEFGN